MRVVAVVAAFACVVSAAQQTAEQRRLTQYWALKAAAASAKAASSVSSLFSHSATARYLRQFDDGSALWAMAPSALEARFWDEVESAELVHNFGDGDWRGANCGYDLTIALGHNASVFPNQWQLQVTRDMPLDPVNNIFTEWSETHLFGFAPFKHVLAPDAATAASRPVYGALNFYRSAGGNPQCGPVAAVFSKRYIGRDALMTPVDSGLYSGCRENETVFGPDNNHTCYICSAWPAPRDLGVLLDRSTMKHLLIPYLEFYNQTQEVAGVEYPQYNLARLLTRLLSRRTYGTDVSPARPLTLNFNENALGYFEANPIVNLTMVNGVKMLVGMFELLWGTADGAALQQWCIRRGWPLAWASNPTMSFWHCGPAGLYPGCAFPANLSAGIDPANARLLDLVVLWELPTAVNMSLSPQDMSEFKNRWVNFNVTNAPHATLDGAWKNVTGRLRDWTLEPLFAGACANPECVGVTVTTRHCVC